MSGALDKDLEFCDDRCDEMKRAMHMVERFPVLVKALVEIRLALDMCSGDYEHTVNGVRAAIAEVDKEPEQ